MRYCVSYHSGRTSEDVLDIVHIENITTLSPDKSIHHHYLTCASTLLTPSTICPGPKGKHNLNPLTSLIHILTASSNSGVKLLFNLTPPPIATKSHGLLLSVDFNESILSDSKGLISKMERSKPDDGALVTSTSRRDWILAEGMGNPPFWSQYFTTARRRTCFRDCDIVAVLEW